MIASNGTAPDATVDVSLVAQYEPPTFIHSGIPPAGSCNIPYSFQFQASGVGPDPITYSATGLPGWAQLAPTTGILSGTPTVVGTYEFSVTASNGFAPDATMDVSLLVGAGTDSTIDVAAGTSYTVPDGTYSGGTTFNVGGNATLTMDDGGTFTGGAVFNVGANATVTVGGTFTGGMVYNVGANAAVTVNWCTITGGSVFNVAQGAVVNFGSSEYEFTCSGTLSGSGAGTVQTEGMAVGIGGLTLNFPGNMFQWAGGAISTSLGDVTNLGTLNLVGSGAENISFGGTLDNFGTIIQTGSGALSLSSDVASYPSTLMNEAGASYLIESDSGIFCQGDNDQGAVINAGTICAAADSGNSAYIDGYGSLSNNGTIEADSGTLNLAATSFAQLSGNTLSVGTLSAQDGATLELPSGTAITSNAANISLGGSGATITGIAGLASNSGSFSVTGGASFTTAGDLSNSGSLTVGAGSTLSVTGNYTQTSTGTLNVQIGGTPVSGLFGQLNVAAAATLAGGFNLALVNGFLATNGQAFPVVSFASASGTFTTFNGLAPNFIDTLNPTNLTVSATTSGVDLLPTSVTAPTSAAAGQNIPVDWQVSNPSSQAASGSWQDSVYLSTTPAITSSSILLGTAEHSGGLAADGTYAGTLTTALPALPPGCYYVLVQVDSLYQVPDEDRGNSTLAATTGQLEVTVPALTLGTPANGAFTAADQDNYYQVTVPAGGALQVALSSAASSGALALYVSANTPPTPYDYQEAADVAGEPNQALTVPQVPTATTYYILVESVAGDAATTGFTLTATQTSALTVSAPSTPYTGGNGGNLTIPIAGTNFPRNVTASLSLGGTTIDAASIDYQSSSEIYATFNLAGAATGNYALQLASGSQQVTAPTTVAVVAATTGNPVSLVLTPPALVAAGRDSVVDMTVTNTSNNDILAPLLELTADGATLKLPSQSTFQGSSLYFLAISPTGPAGTLTPGESVQVQIQFQSITTNPTINLQLNQADDSQTMDWASQESALRIPTIPSAAWPIVFANFEAAMGSTVASYHAVLAADATYLAQLGEPTNDVLQLLEFEVEKANAAYTAQTLVTVTPDDLPAPGMDLTFEQSYLDSISGRYYQGILGGQGWTTNWDITAKATPTGDVAVQMSGSYYYFSLQPNGSYLPGPGDEDEVLALTAGAYRLVEPDGTIYQFNTNGSLDYVEDTNGNRITASYNGSGQLSELTDSNGEYFQLVYNAQGQMSTLTDSNGQTESYGYSGQFLTSYSDLYGTTNYTYVSGGTAAQNGSLSEIAYADNTHIYFTYDAEGRLIDQHCDGGAEDEKFSYLTPGGMVTTDGDGNSTTSYFDLYGATAETVDALGNVTLYKYDSNLNLVQVDAPGGLVYSYSYDTNGNLTSETDPLGYTTTFTYNAGNDLTGYTDAKDNTTSYAYDSNQNLLSITYANGTSQQYSYNPLGEATGFLSADGNAIAATYNADGLITTETFADGASYSYTYNVQGNLTSATDAQGKVTTFVYGNAGNPTELTEVEYPDGTWLKFTYNIVGERTQSVDQTGFIVNYTYDAMGRLQELTDGSGNLIVQYFYDGAGNLIQKDNGNGTFTVYSYDGDDRVLSITNYAPSTGGTNYVAANSAVNSFDIYTYDALGNVLTDTSQDGQWVYSCDADSQLTAAVFTPNATDPDGLTAQNLQYVYDAAGNRISETVNGVVTTYVVNNVNEYTSSTTAGVGTTTYESDASGNLIYATDPSGNTTAYTYNELNELTAVSGPGLSAGYAYNPMRQMVSQTVNGATTNYQVDPTGLGNVVATFSGSGVYNNSGGLTAHYTYGLGMVSQVATAGSASYYDFDITGNTGGITGSTGTYVNKYAYLPFGQTITINATLANPFTFVGQVGTLNLEAGLLGMRARAYNSITGQFTSNDPINIEGGQANIRSYVSNNPVDRKDATGLNSGAAKDLCVHGASGLAIHGIIELTGLLELLTGPESPLFYVGLVTIAGDWALIGGSAFIGNSGALASNLGQLNQVASGNNNPTPNDGGGADGSGCTCGCPDPSSGNPPCTPGPAGGTPNHVGKDPNALVGPAGYGTPNFIADSGNLPYTVEFENDGNAAALAVTVTEQLAANLDWSTFQFGSFGFGPVNVTIPAGLTQYQTTVAYLNTDETPLNVLVAMAFNVQTGLLSVTFTSLDPATGEAPTGVFDGFLYPESENLDDSEGYVQYTVQPKAGLATGATVNQQASVVFDINAALATETVVNTIDSTLPASSVNPLPATEPASFTVSWSGQDPGGSGIASFDVYDSLNGGAYSLWQDDTTATSAVFTGQALDSYAFYSVATSNVGAVQPQASAAVRTTVVGPVSLSQSTVAVSPSPIASDGTATVTLTAGDANGNQELSGGLEIAFGLAAGSAGGTFSAVTDNGNGTYTATFTATKAGSNTVTATIGGTAVTSTLPAVTVVAAASVSKSAVTVSATHVASGNSVTVTLVTRNAKGSQESGGGLAVAFGLGTGSAGGTFSAVTYNGNGTYTATFTATKAGRNTITATIGGKKVGSTLPRLTVVPGAVSLSNSTITLSKSSIASGGALTVTLTARDADGNQEPGGGLAVIFALGSGTAAGTFGKVTDHKNGTYTVTFTAATAGSNTITATIGDQAVTSTPPALTVVPGAVSLSKSTITLSASKVASGTSTTVTLVARDADGNPEPGGLAVKFAMGSGKARGTFSAVTYKSDGTYTATFTGTTAGSNTITVTIGGKAVSSTHPTVTVVPGAVSLSKSTITLSKSKIASGNSVTVTLSARDANGNLETTGGLAVQFALGSGAARGAFSGVTDNGNGTYTATFTGTTAGGNTINAAIGSQAVTSTPPTLTVTSVSSSVAAHDAAMMAVLADSDGGTDDAGWELTVLRTATLRVGPRGTRKTGHL